MPAATPNLICQITPGGAPHQKCLKFCCFALECLLISSLRKTPEVLCYPSRVQALVFSEDCFLGRFLGKRRGLWENMIFVICTGKRHRRQLARISGNDETQSFISKLAGLLFE